LRMMRRKEALRLLREHAEPIRAIGATSLFLFGSTARDDAGENSDLDLFVDYDRASKFSAIELLRIKHYISDTLQIDADVTTRDGLHPVIRDEVVASAERVF
jgi:predicted nucleotidyltransferase